jgi:hypothetical protein
MSYVIFDIFVVVKIQVMIVCTVMLCSDGACMCVYGTMSLHGITTQKTMPCIHVSSFIPCNEFQSGVVFGVLY